ncbi:Tetratricopeptide repeat protein 29-like [Oopsacas minuta]|uniref:Tetratricopeptide repeat protein 29-like n=1 Tax=Oopsacas minuta TaxID=111878 RepID=A0AAV7KAA3_9METZ|nr:Tetratricopeptide repeat protein 29-like [Oopsacas minuta]
MYYHFRNRTIILFVLLVLLVLLCIYLELIYYSGNYTSKIIPLYGNCPADIPPYPNYRYFYKNADNREKECNHIQLQRSSTTERECPDLFIIGARKGGTTSLYQYISQHRGFMGQGLDKNASAGEIHYFSFTFLERSWKDYIDKFSAQRGKKTGESSVSYLTSCMAPYRLRALCGTKPIIVVLLREPVGRMLSTYVMRYHIQANKKESLAEYVNEGVKRDISRWKYLLEEEKILASQLLNQSSFCLFKPARSQIYEGLYSLHLNRWFKYFPRENFLIWRSDEFKDNTSYFLSELIAKLGLQEMNEDELNKITSVYYNSIEYNSTGLARREDMEYLKELYTPFNQQLTDMMAGGYSWQN